MIAGKLAPELGGEPRFLDIIGVNYYAANQWEVPGGKKLHWDAGSNDERWVPLPDLLREVYSRYQRPIFMAETSPYGPGRAAWLREVAEGVFQARQQGIPMDGVCLYPILTVGWEDATHFHTAGSGLSLRYRRAIRAVLNQEYGRVERRAGTAGGHGCK
jgi:hypothetical protein